MNKYKISVKNEEDVLHSKIYFFSSSSSGYLISLCQFCLQLILILGTSGFEVPFMPMPGGQCESNDLKVLGVDLDLDLMQNGTTADAFFEAIGKMHAFEKYDQFALSICIFPLPSLLKQEFRFFFCHYLNPILIKTLASAGTSINPILIF